MRTHHSVLLALTLSLAACGDGSADAKEAGLRALQSGDFAGAATRLEAALAARNVGDSDYVDVAVAHCQALAHVDSRETKAAFLALGDQVTDKDYSIVVAELVNVSELEVAIELLEAGVTRFPESPKLQQIKATIAKTMANASQKSDDPKVIEAQKRISAMGYVGGDE